MVSKITLSVCKVYKNTGRFRFHRKKTKKAWKHYFLEEDEPNEYWFRTQWVDSITAQFLKLKKWHFRLFYCEQCLQPFTRYIRWNGTRPDCSYCEEE